MERVPGPVSAGGSVQLVKLIDKHGRALVADLAHYYHLDLRDLWRPESGLTPRYVLSLVEHLPEDSATLAEVRGGPQMRPWTLNNQLAGAAVNLLYAANRQRAGKPTRSLLVKPPKPRRVTGPRPGVRVANVAAIAARYRREAKD